MSNYEEFKDCNEVKDEEYIYIKKYEYKDNLFYVEPNFYTQLTYLKTHFKDKYQNIVNEILNTVERNHKVIFTADFLNPVVYKDDYIYREINDILADLHLSFDNKSNPDSDWKD